MRVRFGGGFLSDFGAALRREWVVPNGMGGYSSSTVLGVNTRKYHGLLVSSGRRLLLSKLEEEVDAGGTFRLSANEYPGAVYPEGFRYLGSFELDCFPVFSYSLPGISVRKTVFPLRMQDSVCADYVVHSNSEAAMRIFPLVNSRGISSTTSAGGLPFSQSAGPSCTVLNGGVVLCSDRAGYVPSSLPEPKRWYVNMLYREDRSRGEDFLDSHYCPGFFEVSLPEGSSSFRILCGSGISQEKLGIQARDPGLLQRELQRVRRLGSGRDDLLGSLMESADSFLVRSGSSRSVVAGYHWFGEWGRDSLISLPGLCLAAGRFGDAKAVLLRFASRMRNGLMPNILSDQPAYNSADASLWFACAAYKHYLYTSDLHFAGRMLEVIEEIVHSYSQGNPLVRMGSDFLLSCGDSGTQLTWMDAAVGGRPVTPRNGKPVEINVLWYNALRIACELSEKMGADWEECHVLADGVKKSFRKFWNPGENCLFDVLDPDDPSVRPNQVFAVSLPFRLLDSGKERALVEKVRSELLTPYGLRSLSPKDGKYLPVYCPKNEYAYHNGAVWPYLLGPFITSFLRVNGRSEESLGRARSMLLPFQKHMSERGLGCISEVFDGDYPHNPGGCISQAWNVAELLRVAIEERLL